MHAVCFPEEADVDVLASDVAVDDAADDDLSSFVSCIIRMVNGVYTVGSAMP